jgi:lipoyl-dependent peroxiredoxin subunit D
MGQHIEALRSGLVEATKDAKLNLQSVLGGGSLSIEQRWGVAVACAIATRNGALREAVLADARAATTEAVVEDGIAAASLMAMNNVYYRFRHMAGYDGYAQKRAGLRMNRLVRPATNKLDFELVCLAVSAINGCEACIQAHEKVVLDGGLEGDQIHDAVRIAAVLASVAVSLEASTSAALDTAA